MALDKARAARAALKTVHDVPFVWDIAFVEIFEGEKDGFDVVIGNPPYIRKENIADPRIPRETITAENKRQYKDKLLSTVYQAFPRFFCLDNATGVGKRRLDAQADLFIYFYFVGLWLLAQRGSFSFICSNSWLDVGYGSDLQEFLLRHCHVKHIIDNSLKRSFASADINTVICLFSAPNEKSEVGLQCIARFTMFRVPFEQALSPVLMQEIEACQKPTTTPEYRVFPQSQRILFEDGCDVSPMTVSPKERVVREPRLDYRANIDTGAYLGNKWGGKYLRAPDIYWRLVQVAKGHLVKLATLCDVEGYIHDNNTGPDFPEVRFVKSVKDLRRIRVDLQDEAIVRYGVKNEGNSRLLAPIVFPRTFGTRHLVPLNVAKAYFKEFYKVLPKDPQDTLSIAAQLNSTFGILQRELIGLVNLGEGALKFSAADVKQFLVLPDIEGKSIQHLFESLASRPVFDYREELDQQDRRKLDAVIFEALGASKKDREDIYGAVIALIEARVNKAASLDGKGTKKRQKAADSLRGIWAGLPDKAMKELLE